MRSSQPLTTCLALLLTLLSPAWADNATDEARAARVDELFAAWTRPDAPGAALGIIRDGKLLVAKGYGLANLDDAVALTPRSVFEVGSVTKAVRFQYSGG